MFVRDIMNENSVVCTEDTTLAKIYELMMKNDCEYVTVVESRAHRIPIGTITEHDICRQLIERGRNPRDMTAANVMNTNILKIAESLTFSECLNLMQTKQAKRVFIVDEDGMFRGTLTRIEAESLKSKELHDNLIKTYPVSPYRTPGINRIF